MTRCSTYRIESVQLGTRSCVHASAKLLEEVPDTRWLGSDLLELYLRRHRLTDLFAETPKKTYLFLRTYARGHGRQRGPCESVIAFRRKMTGHESRGVCFWCFFDEHISRDI